MLHHPPALLELVKCSNHFSSLTLGQRKPFLPFPSHPQFSLYSQGPYIGLIMLFSLQSTDYSFQSTEWYRVTCKTENTCEQCNLHSVHIKTIVDCRQQSKVQNRFDSTPHILSIQVVPGLLSKGGCFDCGLRWEKGWKLVPSYDT